MKINKLLYLVVFLFPCCFALAAENVYLERDEQRFYSKTDLKEYFGLDTKTMIFAHYMGWWGNGKKRGVDPGYRSDDLVYINGAILKAKAFGIDGFVLNWFGLNDFSDHSFLKMNQVLGRYPDFRFLISLDRGALRNKVCKSCSNTDAINEYIEYFRINYFSSGNYLKINDKYVLFEFGVDEEGKIDWPKIRAVNPDVIFIRIHKSGFRKQVSDGAFLWPLPNKKNDVLRFLRPDYISDFYGEALKSNKIVVGAAFAGFDDSLAPWGRGDPSYIPYECGRTWSENIKKINKILGSKKQVDILQIVTWNDYEEGTAIENGIDGCFAVDSSFKNGFVNFSVKNSQNAAYFLITKRKVRGGSETSKELVPATSDQLMVPDVCNFEVDVEIIGKPFFNGRVFPVYRPLIKNECDS